MKAWIEPAEVEAPAALRAAVGGHPLVAAALTRRGFGDPRRALGFLDPDHYAPASPFDLPDMDRAVARLQAAVARDEQICVWGDFDVDGQTATALLFSALEGLGADVGYHVPVRESEGHGVNLRWLEHVIDGGTRLLLTCDTGVTAHEAVHYARQRSVDVVITDHHELPSELPDAAAVVNPHRLNAGHPLRHLPGVGVAYKLAEALYAASGRTQEAERHLDLVALGIVADVATQKDDTRYLLQRGLHILQQTERLGLQVLMETAQLDPEGLSEEHIAFILGPRLNAVGRLADARSAVELLTTSDLSQARILSNYLETLNAQRRRIGDEVYRAAEAQLAADPRLLDAAALVLAYATWPAGIIGIVASRLVEKYGRPVVLLATPPGAPARGSARSVEGCNITAAIAQQADLLLGYGGHSMAAGLTIMPENIPAFRHGLARAVAGMTGGSTAIPALAVDAYVPLDTVTLELAAEVGRLAPFGPGNPPVVLAARNVVLDSTQDVGRDDEHRLATVADAGGNTRRVIWWDGAGEPLPTSAFDLAFVIRAHDFRGEPQVEIEWVDYRQTEAAIEVAKPKTYAVVDHRGAGNGRQILAELTEAGDIAIWREGGTNGDSGGNDRYALQPAETLVVWTTPPGSAELRAALARVRPERVVLFGVDPAADAIDVFLRRLTGLAQYALARKDGKTTVAELAAACGVREDAIRLGLTWLVAHGDLRVTATPDGNMLLQRGDGTQQPDLVDIRSRLTLVLAETAAYRRHFHTAPPDTLLPPRI